MNSDQKPTMTARECAEALSLSKNTVYQLLRTKQIPCIRLNRRLIIPRKRFEAFLNGDSSQTGRLPNE